MAKGSKKAVPTTPPKKSHKSMSQMVKDMSFTISIDPFNTRKFTTSEIGRGCGVERNKKGKGSYTRKAKHSQPYG